MNLLRFSRPLGYHSFTEGAFNHLLRDLEIENCYAIPQANVLESSDNFRIELSVAGFTKEQIGIQFQDNILIVKGSVEEKPNENEKYLTREFGIKSFVRRFSLPKTIDTEQISAGFSNGILSVNIPKQEEVKEKEPKDIIIN